MEPFLLMKNRHEIIANESAGQLVAADFFEVPTATGGVLFVLVMLAHPPLADAAGTVIRVPTHDAISE